MLIIGTGNAGLVAAIEARNHGASVLLLGKGPRERRGGNSRLSGGHFRIAFDRGKPDFEYLLKDSVLPKGETEIEPYTKDAYYADLMMVTEGLAKVVHLFRPEYENAIHAQSDAIAGLAEEIGVAPDALVRTVKEYNGAITKDTKFDPSKRNGLRTKGLKPDKTNWAQPIDTPPYKAFAVVCGITFTYGGLKVNEKCRVIDTRGLPIEGLYAIGEMSGGLFFYNYPSGTGLVKGAIGGRIAAAEAVARAFKK